MSVLINMQTPSEPHHWSEFGAGSPTPRRSVFANFRAPPQDAGAFEAGQADAEVAPEEEEELIEEILETTGAEEGELLPADHVGSKPHIPERLQAAVDSALARSFIYQLIARAFETPELETWQWLTQSSTRSAFWSAIQANSSVSESQMTRTGAELLARLVPGEFEAFRDEHVKCFGHAARGDCPINEIEYGEVKADPLFQPHRLADLGAFYAAFGLELAADAAERQDHISMELEFMSVLAAKEAYAFDHRLDRENIVLGREAQRKFLREHLGRWSIAFAHRLARMSEGTSLGALSNFTREFIVSECLRFGLTPGSEEQLLRPIEPAAESICASCGIKNLPPGASI